MSRIVESLGATPEVNTALSVNCPSIIIAIIVLRRKEGEGRREGKTRTKEGRQADLQPGALAEIPGQPGDPLPTLSDRSGGLERDADRDPEPSAGFTRTVAVFSAPGAGPGKQKGSGDGGLSAPQRPCCHLDSLFFPRAEPPLGDRPGRPP